MSSFAARVLGVVVLTLAFCAGVVVYIVLYLSNTPPAASVVQTPSGPHLYVATVAASKGMHCAKRCW